jgi:hypothetical protein
MDYADEIIDKINSGETGTVAGDEEAKKIISQTNANAGLKPVVAVKKSASTPGYPAPVTIKDHKISLKNAFNIYINTHIDSSQVTLLDHL